MGYECAGTERDAYRCAASEWIYAGRNDDEARKREEPKLLPRGGGEKRTFLVSYASQSIPIANNRTWTRTHVTDDTVGSCAAFDLLAAGDEPLVEAPAIAITDFGAPIAYGFSPSFPSGHEEDALCAVH